MKHEKLSDKWFYWKLHHKVKFHYWLAHQKLKWRMIKVGWEERYEHDCEPFRQEGYTPFQFLKQLYVAILFNKICWNCKGYGMTGYYEPESCTTCDGYCFNWANEKEMDYEKFAKWDSQEIHSFQDVQHKVRSIT